MKENMKKTTKGEWVYLILSVCSPLLFFVMCLPWDGEVNLINANVFSITIFAIQCLALITSVTQLIFHLMQKTCSCMFCAVSCLLTVLSFALVSFVGFFFLLEMLGIPWFPAQS